MSNVIDIKLKCPKCKKKLSESHLRILAAGRKVKKQLKESVEDISQKDHLCWDCYDQLD